MMGLLVSSGEMMVKVLRNDVAKRKPDHRLIKQAGCGEREK